MVKYKPFPSAVQQDYQTEPVNEYVIQGNDAIVRCTIPSFVSDFVSVASWVDSEGNEIHRQTSSSGTHTITARIL